jgi:hypothetical protein
MRNYLFLREKQNYLEMVSSKSKLSLFQEKQNLNVKSDSSIRISWEDNQDDLIDVAAEDITPTTTESKD